MSTTESSTGPAPGTAVPLPPPPPPMPGSMGAINVPTYKETKQKNDEIKKAEAAKSSIQDSQFANLPDKLMNTMKREKKPFTYTPLSVGDNGKLDLSQIKSPKMKKRLMANMKDEEEQDENRTIESIDDSLQNNRKQTDLDRELSSPIPIRNQQSSYLSEPAFSPSVQTKPSLVVPLSVLNDNFQMENQTNGYQPTLPQRQTSFGYDFNRPLSPDEKLDEILNEQLKRSLSPDLNNNNINSTPSFYDQPYNSAKTHYGNVKPKKINIAQELSDERNFNCVPSQYSSTFSTNITNPKPYSQPATDYSQPLTRQWSNSNATPPITSAATNSGYSIPIEIQKNRPQYYSNPQLDYLNKTSTPSTYERPSSGQGVYQIPIINQNSVQARTVPPQPPQRQQSLNRSFQEEKEIPVQYEEPIQSRSFKILQKLTADIEDEIDKLKVFDQQNKSNRDPLEDKLPAYFGTLNHIEQPRLRSERRIPIQVDDQYTSSQPEYHSKNEQNWYSNHTSSSLNSTTPSTNSFWSSPVDWTPQIPASRQPQITPPNRYQGSNIPSRSFRILQMLTDGDEW